MEHLEEVKAQTATRPPTLGTGGESDHDGESITARSIYHWKSILEVPLRKHQRRTTKVLDKFGMWLGVTPL